MKSFRLWNTKVKWIAGVVAVVSIALLSFVAYFTWQVYSTLDSAYEEVERLPSDVRNVGGQNSDGQHDEQNSADQGDHEQDNLDTEQDLEPAKVRTLLILGLDRREGTADIGRTDAIILAILNESTGRISLTSIPRDTYVDIAGQGYKDKINHSYQYGLGTTIATVENFTRIPVDHYVLFNFRGFEKAVDLLGGVTVDVDASIARNRGGFEEGKQLLTGRQALAFSRFRYDRDGDFGRNERQQKVIKAFLDASQNTISPTKISNILSIIGEDVRTDLKIRDIITLGMKMEDYTSGEVTQFRYSGTTDRFGPQNLSYVVISEDERHRVNEQMQEFYVQKEK